MVGEEEAEVGCGWGEGDGRGVGGGGEVVVGLESSADDLLVEHEVVAFVAAGLFKLSKEHRGENRTYVTLGRKSA